MSNEFRNEEHEQLTAELVKQTTKLSFRNGLIEGILLTVGIVFGFVISKTDKIIVEDRRSKEESS